MRLVPRMLRSAPHLRRGALLVRGPWLYEVGPGSAAHRQEALHRVRDMLIPRAIVISFRDNPQRRRAADGPINRQLVEIRFACDRLVEQRTIAPPRDLDRAKAAQVLGHILRVEQRKAARDQPRHQMHQRHLRGVAGTMKHALAEEGAAEADPVQPTDKVVILPDLDAVAMSDFMQPDVEIADALVDPGVVAARLWRGTA